MSFICWNDRHEASANQLASWLSGTGKEALFNAISDNLIKKNQHLFLEFIKIEFRVAEFQIKNVGLLKNNYNALQ